MARSKPAPQSTVPAPSPAIEHFSVSLRILRQAQDLRLDASFFNPAVAKALEMLRRSGMELKRLGDITTDVFLAPRFRRIYVSPEYGVPFLQGSHIVHFQPADVKYLSRTAHKRLDRWIIHAGWILVTCSGTVGRVMLCPEDWDGWAASQHILRIVPNDEACPRGYLYSFLASPLGHIQLTKPIYGAVVDELTEDQAKNVLVPLPVTDEQRALVADIDQEARDAVSARSQAVRLITDAVDDIVALVHADREDAATARQRLAEIEADPSALVTGDELAARLDDLSR